MSTLSHFSILSHVEGLRNAREEICLFPLALRRLKVVAVPVVCYLRICRECWCNYFANTKLYIAISTTIANTSTGKHNGDVANFTILDIAPPSEVFSDRSSGAWVISPDPRKSHKDFSIADLFLVFHSLGHKIV
jgi:hypothetical protein